MPRNLDLALDRQRRHRPAGGFDGCRGVGLLSALRRRRDVLRAARRRAARRGAGHLRRRDRRLRPRRAVVLHEHGRPRHPLVRHDGRRGRDHGLRAPIHAARPRVPPDVPRAHRTAHGRQPAHPHPLAAGRGLRTRASGDHRRQQPHPLRHAGRDAAAHDRRVADRHPRGAAVLPGRHRHAAARARRNRAERRGRDRPPVRRGDDQVLARLGAPARDPVRMAGRGDPRGDHAAAERVRRHRRDRRGDDDVDPRGRRVVPQLGLPLLLAARRLLRRRRAEPAGRHRNHGGLSRVHRRHRRRQRRSRCSPSIASTAISRSARRS